MANLPETPQWEDGIYQIEVSDPVLGGPDGISNRQAKQLASRTSYLKQQVEKGSSDLSEHIKAADPHTQYAPKASPTFTGNPAAPTVVKTDNSTKLANTAHVKTVVADYAPLASPALTGTPTAPTAPQTVNNTQIATTAFVKSALAALVASSPEALDTLNELAAALGNDPNFATTMTNALAGKQPLDNTLTALSGKSVAALLEYLGLRELYLALTGGTLKGPLNIEYVGGRGLTTGATAGTSIYHELYLLGKLVAWWGIINSNELVLENRVAGKKLIIGPDGFKIDGKDIATTEQLFGVGQTYRNLTTSRQNKVWYTNTDSKPRIVHVETNRTGTQYPFSIDIQVIHNGVQHRADYRWTTADEVICLTAVIPPGARYSVNGGWGQPTEWTVINFWLEYSL
ncbi:hypothetical protein [Morganella morganii]|uniref:hypothetical protein n=1 Tax=Morganella morganii TaxID=582 RepID=UPI003315FA26